MGEKLVSQISEATGLPGVEDELNRLVASAGLKPGDVTLEDLRKILAEYLQDVLLEVKDDLISTDAPPQSPPTK